MARRTRSANPPSPPAPTLLRIPVEQARQQIAVRVQAGKAARKNVAFFDITFSVPKSITVLHAAFEAEEVKARAAGDLEKAQAWAAHKRGLELAQYCQGVLARAQQQVKVLEENTLKNFHGADNE